MIRIKAVDAQNILEVCGLASNRDGACAAIEVCSDCNAVSIAEAKYDPEMRPNAIYNNNAPIGFLCINAQKIKPKRRLSAVL